MIIDELFPDTYDLCVVDSNNIHYTTYRSCYSMSDCIVIGFGAQIVSNELAVGCRYFLLQRMIAYPSGIISFHEQEFYYKNVPTDTFTYEIHSFPYDLKSSLESAINIFTKCGNVFDVIPTRNYQIYRNKDEITIQDILE